MCEEVFADLLVPMWNDGRRCDKLLWGIKSQALGDLLPVGQLPPVRCCKLSTADQRVACHDHDAGRRWTTCTGKGAGFIFGVLLIRPNFNTS